VLFWEGGILNPNRPIKRENQQQPVMGKLSTEGGSICFYPKGGRGINVLSLFIKDDLITKKKTRNSSITSSSGRVGYIRTLRPVKANEKRLLNMNGHN